MTAIGGSIEVVNLKGRDFSVAADSDSTRKLGGYDNEHQDNGDGTGRLIKTRKGWSLTGINLVIDDSSDDQEFIEDLKNETDYFPIGITYASGITYNATGQVTGETPSSSQSATMPVDLMGPGKLTKQ